MMTCRQTSVLPVYMPPEERKMTREGAERLSTGSSSRVRWKAPRVLVAKLSSRPSAEFDRSLACAGTGCQPPRCCAVVKSEAPDSRRLTAQPSRCNAM